MKNKQKFWLSSAFAMAFVCAPILAHAAQLKGAPLPSSPQAAQPAPRHFDPDQRNAQRTIPGAYRLTYTLTEMDGTRRVGSQRYAIVLDAAEGPPARVDLGTRIPIATAAYLGASAPDQNPQTVYTPGQTPQIVYIDIGLSIDASLRQFANGLELRTKVVQSSLDTQPTGYKAPLIRQAKLESSVLLNADKPMLLGSLDTPGSTHRLDVQVTLTHID